MRCSGMSEEPGGIRELGMARRANPRLTAQMEFVTRLALRQVARRSVGLREVARNGSVRRLLPEFWHVRSALTRTTESQIARAGAPVRAALHSRRCSGRRTKLPGRCEFGRMLVVVYTETGDRIRIISGRKVTPTERRHYERQAD